MLGGVKCYFARDQRLIPSGEESMNEIAHIKTTKLAIKIANQIIGPCFTGQKAALLAAASADPDHFQDVEFVHVKGGRDNPHQREWLAVDDKAHFRSGGINLTAFNHYIDIKKGPGLFDDYDGYSYYRGSAHKGQYQKASQLTQGWAYISAKLMGWKVDEGISYWLNDEYVHTAGRQWYKDCSPALKNYSYPHDQGVYANKQAELAARFPLAGRRGKPGHGFPYSVFMPVDNLARYWFEQFRKSGQKRWEYLGPVMHAIQDAGIPHHAAGYSGNWHVEYEKALDKHIKSVYREPDFHLQVKKLTEKWYREDPRPPSGRLRLRDRGRKPAINWEIRQLITWLALHAYHAYAKDYNHFSKGFKPNNQSLGRLYILAAAMSGLVLLKAVTKHTPGSLSN
jgi:hypothetical protein